MRTKEITFLQSNVKHILSTVIATRPYPIDLALHVSTIDMDTFLERLQGRNTPFGSLETAGTDHDVNDIRRLFDHLDLFEYLSIYRMPSEFMLRLQSGPMKRISFCADEGTEGIDLTATEISLKDISIYMASHVEFPSRLMLSFLHRVAQIGHLEKLTLTIFSGRPVPTDVGRALIDAVVASKMM